MDLRAIAESKLAAELEELYEGYFRKKYGTNPNIEQSDRNTFTWLATSFEVVKARNIVECYFKIQDRFVAGKNHPIKFLRAEINQILPLLPKEQKKNSSKPRVQVPCDMCGIIFYTDKDTSDPDNPRDCDTCIANPKTFMDLEPMLIKLPSIVAENLCLFLGMPPQLAQFSFGKYCNKMITEKMEGKLHKDFNWKAYEDAVALTARLLTERRKHGING